MSTPDLPVHRGEPMGPEPSEVGTVRGTQASYSGRSTEGGWYSAILLPPLLHFMFETVEARSRYVLCGFRANYTTFYTFSFKV